MRFHPPFFILLCFALSCSNSTGSIALGNEASVRKAISDDWQAMYMETVASRKKIPQSQASSVIFYEDGTYSSGFKEGVIVNKGRWDYDPQTHMLLISSGTNQASSRVLKLTADELILAEYTLMNNEIMDSIVVTYRRS